MKYTYYLSNNTSEGYVSFFDELVGNFSKIIVLKNITKVGRKKLFEKVTDLLDNSHMSYDKIIKCGTVDDVDAVIMNDMSTVIADDELFLKQIPLYADVIDFGEHLRLDGEAQFELTSIKNKIDVLQRRMFRHLENAKKIHDQWEKIYIENTDYEKLNVESDNFMHSIFDGLSVCSDNVNCKNENRF